MMCPFSLKFFAELSYKKATVFPITCTPLQLQPSSYRSLWVATMRSIFKHIVNACFFEDSLVVFGKLVTFFKYNNQMQQLVVITN